MTLPEAKANIYEVISEYVKLKKSGHEYVGLCPFHNEKTPSFYVNVQKQVFHCQGCEAAGSVVDFIMKIKSVDFQNAIELLGVDPIKKEKVKILPPSPKLSDASVAFFKSRGITGQTVKDLKIGQVGDKIAFPFYVGQEIVNIKYRAEGKKFSLVPGGELTLYNVNQIKGAETVYITEGEIDAATLHQCGFSTVVSVPNGKSVRPDDWKHLLAKAKTIYLATDMDEPGIQMRDRCIASLGANRCLIVEWPDECKDANETMLKISPEAVSLALSLAKPAPLPEPKAKPTEDFCFWDLTKQGKPIIDRKRLNEFLHVHGGFGLYFYDPNSTIYQLIRIKKDYVFPSTPDRIKHFLMKKVDLIEDENLKSAVSNLLIKDNFNLFSKGALEFLPKVYPDFLRDTAGEAFFPFQNGVVVINKNRCYLKPYKELNKVIWHSQVKQFDIAIDPNFDVDWMGGEYARFIQKISADDPVRIFYAVTLIGYLLHKYKDPGKAFAVILAEETDNEATGGGTGKGLFFKAIAELINTLIIDGKGFRQDKSFAFQRASLDTNLMVLEDVKKDVDFELFYPMITEGMTIEKKNKDELFIPYPDSPKIGFTTNYSVRASGNHGKRRQRILEFSDHYGPELSPEIEFGHKLFLDWNDAEWQRFYNFCFYCVSSYLQNGIKTAPLSDSFRKKEIRVKYGSEFMEWLEEFCSIPGHYSRPIMQKDLYTQFLNEAGVNEKYFSQKRFRSGLESGLELYNLVGNVKKNYQAGGGKEWVFSRKPD